MQANTFIISINPQWQFAEISDYSNCIWNIFYISKEDFFDYGWNAGQKIIEYNNFFK